MLRLSSELGVARRQQALVQADAGGMLCLPAREAALVYSALLDYEANLEKLAAILGASGREALSAEVVAMLDSAGLMAARVKGQA